MHPVTSPSPADTCVRSCIALSDVFARLVAMEHHSHHSRLLIPVCGAYGGLYPNLSRINFLGPSFFQNKCPFPKKGTTPRRTWYKKKIQNQFWDHGGKHFWIKFQWPRSCLSFSYEVDVGVENTLLRNKQPSAILLRFLVETKTCFGGRFDFTPSRAETPTAG